MDIRKINNEISVAAQISADEVASIAALGFQSIICNRPDGEEMHQPVVADIATAAQNANIEFVDMPIFPGNFGMPQAVEFSNAYDALPKPILAYCRTGTRCATLWALANLEALGRENVLEATQAAGYELALILPERPDPSKG